MSVNNLYYEKYLKYKNKYINLQSQIGGYPPVFIAITDKSGKTTVVSATEYQAYAYNMYFAIKQMSYEMYVPTRDDKYRKDWNIIYVIEPGKVFFEIMDETQKQYQFNIIDFNYGEIGMGDDSFCILVTSYGDARVLSNKEQ